MMEYMIMPLKRYADFRGRSRRQEYWMFALGLTIVTILALVLMFGLGAAVSGGGTDGDSLGIFGGTMGILLLLFFLAILVPSIAVQVRRFHDQDKSGWFVLLGLIPYVGGLVVFVFMCIEGTPGPNRYGPDPKNPDDHLKTVFR